MAAIIRFQDGTEARLLGENGKWECVDQEMKKNLELITELLPYRYYPDPVAGIAREVAKEAGAEVIHIDPSNEGPLDPDAEY